MRLALPVQEEWEREGVEGRPAEEEVWQEVKVQEEAVVRLRSLQAPEEEPVERVMWEVTVGEEVAAVETVGFRVAGFRVAREWKEEALDLLSATAGADPLHSVRSRGRPSRRGLRKEVEGERMQVMEEWRLRGKQEQPAVLARLWCRVLSAARRELQSRARPKARVGVRSWVLQFQRASRQMPDASAPSAQQEHRSRRSRPIRA